ncbi:MAG: HD domain-containing protein [Bacteroidota bacterium]
MKKTLQEEIDVEALLQPENPLEHSLILDPEYARGLMWGKPRFGHPEGKIIFHIREVLDNIDRLFVSEQVREDLRLIAFVHDTFKHLEDKTEPRDWSKHHGIIGRHFLEKFDVADKVVLDVIELHDEAYYAWRLNHLYSKPLEGQKRLSALLDRMEENLQIYYLFFKCDTRTGDKIQAPVKWFEKTVEGIDIISF